MIARFSVPVLIGVSLFAVVSSMKGHDKGRHICGPSEECKMATMKCQHLVMGMKCSDMDEMDEIARGCLWQNNLGNDYDIHYNMIGKYTPSPAKSFLDSLMNKDRVAADQVYCCIIKEKGVSTESGTIDINLVAKELLENTMGNEALKEALMVGKEKCSVPDSCDIMNVKECIMRECIIFLTP